jgi:excisionase family DNA binding protein
MEYQPIYEWLTLDEAAAYLKIHPRTLALWARQKKVPAHRLSGIRRCIWRFLRRELDAMLCVSSADSADGGQQ